MQAQIKEGVGLLLSMACQMLANQSSTTTRMLLPPPPNDQDTDEAAKEDDEVLAEGCAMSGLPSSVLAGLLCLLDFSPLWLCND